MTQSNQTDVRRWRLGVVSYLNSRPLIEGLDADPSVELTFDVPARLPDMLDRDAVDASLVPVVDLVHPRRSWRIVSDACIGCDGETLTVRVFSRRPPGDITVMHVDGDSHTSVTLARVLWNECYGRSLEMRRFCGTESYRECEAILLIGDKVVTQAPVDYEIQTDLGSLWKSLTGLPFVFAAWAAKDDGRDLCGLADLLGKARDAGTAAAEMIAEDFGPGHGWPVTLAKRYLTRRLGFTMSDRHRDAMERFLGFARAGDAIASDSRKLVFA